MDSLWSPSLGVWCQPPKSLYIVFRTEYSTRSTGSQGTQKKKKADWARAEGEAEGKLQSYISLTLSNHIDYTSL